MSVERVQLFDRVSLRDRRDIAAALHESPEFNEAETETALELVDEALRDPSTTYRFLMAREGSSFMGYLCYGPTPMTEATFDLYWLAVAPAWRGRGVGRILCEELERRLAGEALTIRVETSTRPLYDGTIAFYRRVGYQEVGRIPDFYAEGDDLLIFTRRLR